ncbi:hypothetical protein ACWIUA_00335 [Ursidibacter sp. B-7004-1]
MQDMIYLEGFRIQDGEKQLRGDVPFALRYLPVGFNKADGFYYEDDKNIYVIWGKFGSLVDGSYFIVVENSSSIRYLTGLPNNRVRVDGGKFSFEADLGDITVVGKVVLKIERV